VQWLEELLSRPSIVGFSWKTILAFLRITTILSRLLPKSRVRGSLIMDAHLAALAIEHGATLYTNDRDFARFPGLKVEYPLQ
jgi:predicted nucleic acid-binding protein